MPKRSSKSRSGGRGGGGGGPALPDFTGTERIVVIYGQEPFLRGEAMRRLSRAMEQTHGEVERIRVEGPGAQLSDVMDELRGMGLMQQHKLVIVDDADDFVKKHREALERYAASPEETATLVLRPNTWQSNTRLSKAAVKVGQVVKCEEVKPWEAQRWLLGHAKERYGAKLETAAADRLIERVGTDLGRLDSEVAKLAVAAGEGQAITVERVDELTGRGSEEQAWAIQEALLSGNAERALGKLHELVDLSGQPDVLVTYFVADLVRKLHHAAVMRGRGERDDQICKTLRVWGDRRQPFMKAAKKLGTRGAAKALAVLVEADSRSKSGYGDAVSHLERFCTRFAAAVR